MNDPSGPAAPLISRSGVAVTAPPASVATALMITFDGVTASGGASMVNAT